MSIERLKSEIQDVSKEHLDKYIKQRLITLNYNLVGWEEYVKAETWLLEDLNPKNKHSISKTKEHINYANDMINDIKQQINYLSKIDIFL